MITEKELIAAIRQCETEPITQSKIAKLADFYIVYDHLFGEPYEPRYSGAGSPEKIIQTNGGSEFLNTIDGKEAEKVWKIIDELMESLKVLQPRIYDAVLRKIDL